MKTRFLTNRLTILAVAICCWIVSAQESESANVLFHRGLHLEEVKGELEQAIAIYEQVLKKFPDERSVAAKAQLHIGICYEKLGNTSEALTAYRKILKEYSKFWEVVLVAREKLTVGAPGSTAEEHGIPEIATVTDWASAIAGAATWITVSSPFTGDKNNNGYSSFEYSSSSTGPWTQVFPVANRTPGSSEWRKGVVTGLMPNTSYYFRVIYFDPDGVIGMNPQVLGPITTMAKLVKAVTVGEASITVSEVEILVTVPISDDANFNSLRTVEMATTPEGPWITKGEIDRSMTAPPVRLRSLIPGTDYWIRITVTDPDGVNGTNPQIIGPIEYSGAENLALYKQIRADPGWGCCADASQLVDGIIQYPDWQYGFAWRGGNAHWDDGTEGWKQATIDLGFPSTFNHVIVWFHDSDMVPITWKIQHSNDGITWADVFSTSVPMCRSATEILRLGWAFPSCAHRATFPPVTARYVRYTFDDRTLFNGIHGWAVELEIYHIKTPAEVQ